MHDKVNVVLLTVDSLRADHLGCFGYKHPTSPFMDELAAQGVLAERFFCTVTPTHPSYTTMLTGQYPTTHNIISHAGEAELASDAPMLPEALVAEGYTTCSVDTLWRHRYWFGRGFEYVIDPATRRNLMLLVDAETLNHRAIPWIHEHKHEPFFLFMHYWDPHTPYYPPARYRGLFYEGNPIDPDNHSLDEWYEGHFNGEMARETWLRTPQGPVTDTKYVAALYDQEIRNVDDGLRAVVNTIDELGLAEQTLVVVIGDHGESLTEHGVFFEHQGLHDTVTHVPMIMRLPGIVPAGLRLPQMLQHVDLAPTLLDAAGVSIPATMEGKSYWPLATGKTTVGGYDAIVTAESTWQTGWSIRTDDYKYIKSRDEDDEGNAARELYDLKADPDELHNLVDERPELAAELDRRLEDWIAERLRIAGRDEDPVRAQGISMGVMLGA